MPLVTLNSRWAFRRILALILLPLALAACDPLIGAYSAEAYKNATSLKARSLAMIDRSGRSYSSQQTDVTALMTDIDAAYEFSKGLPKNEISARQWQLMRDPDEGLMGGFVAGWKRNGTVGGFFRSEKKTQIARAYDYIICLEVNKQKATPCAGLASN
ncbi:hypothetical protein [Sedimentitalea nanhaiensis]|uniref:Uncharacterized protein n=1 Tax=Sedimentitalea nanhaiensis TaxID=999627 RepID=A0A1I7CUR3_9RHOB|nr:hypothetical protein [Sedimentitalea nanhaiensis]SFU03126.1 hypothetical protein SAMN05216236_1206 [Sedimentitalea nanhaiensis]